MAPGAFPCRGLLLFSWSLVALVAPPAAAVTGRGRLVEDILAGEPPQLAAALPGDHAGPAPPLEHGNSALPLEHGHESSRKASEPAPTALALSAGGSLQQLSGGRRQPCDQDDDDQDDKHEDEPKPPKPEDDKHEDHKPQGGGHGQGLPSRISLYHWSPHYQCFQQNKRDCANQARAQVTRDLKQYDVDFGNVIEMSGYSPPAGYGMSKGQCDYDVVVVLYKQANWEPGQERPGCMAVKGGHTDRAFLVMTFKSKSSGEEVVFVGAHFPHVNNHGDGRMNPLKEKIVAATSGATKKLIFVADTNLEIDSLDIAGQLGIPNLKSAVKSHRLPTCCWERGRMGGARYDRIVANFGRSLEGVKRLHADPVPSWAGDEMHAGLSGTLVV